MERKIIVVDNFYEFPEEVRAFALNCEYTEPMGSWMGLHSFLRHPSTKDSLFRIAKMVSDLPPNWEEIDASYQFWRKAACGGFATLFDGQKGIIHSHRRSGDWAGVLYLSNPEHCVGRDGTLFFRHTETGLEYFNGHEDDENFQKAKRDARDYSCWELVESIEMQYNRLVLFDSRFFHAPSVGFGENPTNCRLIQVFNFVIPETIGMS